MSVAFVIRVYDRGKVVYVGEFAEPVELGRQRQADAGAYTKSVVDGRCRLVIAGQEETSVPRQHAVVTPVDGGKVRLNNLSNAIPVHLFNGDSVAPGASCDVPLPAVLTLGKRTIRVQSVAAEGAEAGTLHRLAEATMAPFQSKPASVALPSLSLQAGPETGVESVLLWLQGAMAVLQSAATSTDFFRKAAEAVVNLVGLDAGRVLILDDEGSWSVRALAQSPAAGQQPPAPPSRRALGQMLGERRTVWFSPALNGGAGGASLSEIDAVVAAPILDRDGQVIGVLYGDRRCGGRLSEPAPITKPEALLVELLAGGVAAGLARVELEKAALAARVRFEQFFTPELARVYAARPDLLEGRDAEVTVLFADIRGFSRISEALDPARTLEWIGDVMGVLSDCIMAHGGVVVDYIGDEVLAMWGAPEAQPDHARRACLAALDMLRSLDGLNARWHPVLKQPTDLGIGVNTGIARVGNTGSHRKFKYGPLGNTVNVGSRVQGANKYLKTRLLITGATREHLGPGHACRRICRAGVINIAEPLDLFELSPPGPACPDDLWKSYEAALARFEAAEFGAAAKVLGNVFAAHPDDGPSQVLMSRTIPHLGGAPANFSPVWMLPGK